MTINLETGSIPRLLSKFAVPGSIALLVNALYNIVDQIFIGRGVGYLGNAATNVAFPLVTISLAISLLIGNGAASSFSLLVGAKNKEEAARNIGHTVVLSAICGILLLVLSYMFFRPMLYLFGATDKVIGYSVEYVKIIIIGLPFAVVGTALSSIIRADGSPTFSMLAMIIGAIINTILDPVFIFIFDMGVGGAALATILGQIATCALSLLYLRKVKSVKLTKKDFILSKSITKTIFALGASSLLNQLSMCLVQIVLNNSLRHYGAGSVYGSEIPLSAVGIVMKVNMILISFIIGIATGAQPILGYNYGAKNYSRVNKTYNLSVIVGSVLAVIGFFVFEFFPQSIINIFGQEDALYNEFAVMCFRVYLALIFVVGFQIISANYFQAIGFPLKAAILTMSRQILFFIPLLVVLPSFFGIVGALYAMPVADALAATVTAICIIKEKKRLKSLSLTEE